MRSQLFPDLRPEEYAALKADIAERGVLVPVVLDADTGEVLDGHNRLRIARELGIEPPGVQRRFASDGERLAHVIALNLKRRHLGPSPGESSSCITPRRGACSWSSAPVTT